MSENESSEHKLEDYAIGQWWIAALRDAWGKGVFDNDTRRACKVAEDFAILVLTPKEEKESEFLYRYRSFHNPKFSSTPGWGDWEFIDEKKYHEIVAYIEGGAHYQVQKLDSKVAAEHSLDVIGAGMYDVLYRYNSGHESSWIVCTRDEFYAEKQFNRSRTVQWADFEISRDNGVTWESA